MAWSAPRWMRRAAGFVPAVGCALLAVMLVGAASSTTVLACERGTARCTWSTSSLFSRRDQVFAIDSVREVRFIDGLGKNGQRAETALIFGSGTELHVASDRQRPARQRHDAIHGFFAGGGESLRDVDDDDAVAFGLLLAALAAAIAAVVVAVRAARRPVVDRVPVAATTPRRRLWSRPWVRNALVIGGLAVTAQVALLTVADLTQGTLVLDCRLRCRFQGGECLPGGGLRSSLDAGDYTLEVWAASGLERWRPRAFTIAVGEVTHVVCE